MIRRKVLRSVTTHTHTLVSYLDLPSGRLGLAAEVTFVDLQEQASQEDNVTTCVTNW